MSNNKKFYDIVETVSLENDEIFSMIEEDTKLEMADEIEELFETGEYSMKELKQHVKENLQTNDEYLMDKFNIDEEDLIKYKDVSNEIGRELVYTLEHKEDLSIYDMDEEEFVLFCIEELQIFGEVPEKVIPYIDTEDVYESLLRFDFTETKHGFVYWNF